MKFIKNILIFSVFVVSTCFAEVSNITNVNFLQEGEVSKIILDFDGPVNAERKHIKDDKQIILDIQNANAQKKFLRGIDTSEFSGSIVYVSPYKKPGSKNDVRFAIQLRENVRSFIERKKNRIILHVENRFGVFTRAKLKKVEEQNVVTEETEDGEKQKVLVPKSNSIEDILENLTQSGVKRYVGRKISINVDSLPYEEVLKIIAETSGFNIMIDEEVKKLPALTINLTNLPWDQVLDTIMDLGKLVGIKFGNILTIKTAAQARTEKQLELDQKNANKTLDPLVTKIFPISYGVIQDIIAILNGYTTQGRGSITSDPRTQSIIVKDTVDVIEKMKKIIDTLDTQTPQILITSKIIEAEEDYEFRAGLAGQGFTFDYDPFVDLAGVGSDTGSFGFNSVTSTDNPNAIGASISVFKRLSNLDFIIDLMETESKIKIISSPKIVAENNQDATITSSDVRNFPVSVPGQGGVNLPQFQEVQANTELKVKPKVTNEGSILLELTLTKDSFGTQEAASIPPPRVSNTIDTSVLVDNGSTVVVGGIYTTEDQEFQSGIPFLKDLPIIGWLFKSAYNPKKNRRELIVFITPRIINQEEAGLNSTDIGEASF